LRPTNGDLGEDSADDSSSEDSEELYTDSDSEASCGDLDEADDEDYSP
jgi:hypothetical protein